MRLLALVLLLLSANLLSARTVTVAWDASPASGVVAYEMYVFDETAQAWVMIAETLDDPATTEIDPPLQKTIENFPDGVTRSHVRAVHSSGMRSEPSNEIAVPELVEPPSGYRVKVTVTVEVLSP